MIGDMVTRSAKNNKNTKILVLGGSGLVGYQVARKLLMQPDVAEMAISALGHSQTLGALQRLRAEFPSIPLEGFCGDLFVAGEPSAVEEGGAEPARIERGEPGQRRRIFDHLYGDFEAAYQASMLSKLILRVKPDVVVDCVNTATGISYQDVFTSSQAVRAALDAGPEGRAALTEDIEKLLISLSVPQLILHMRILNRALRDASVGIYLKIGTTGTGGMGLNIPYTHGEERPSPQLLNKTAVAFAQTGMLFLMGRTPGGPIVKELKPAALIGYRGAAYREALGRQYHALPNGEYTLGEANEPYVLYKPRMVKLEGELDLRPDASDYETLAAPDGSTTLKVPVVDTGENGLFTRGEFEVITALDQMEYITPEEIADYVVMEVRGASTGKDVVGAVDAAVLGASYKAGLLRPAALDFLARLEETHGMPSIALGRLGPPEMAKLLFEAYLLKRRYGTLAAVLEAGAGENGEELLSRELSVLLSAEPLLSSLMISVGIPILEADGQHLLRGPVIKSPSYRSFRPTAPLSIADIERYAQTWVDLRPARMKFWLSTFQQMSEKHFAKVDKDWSTAEVDRSVYLPSDIQIGSVVAWIVGNQGQGFRML